MAKESFSDYVPYDQQPGVKKKNNAILILTGFLILFIIIIASSFKWATGTNDSTVVQATSSPRETTVAEVSSDCSTIRTDITMLRTSFSQGKDTPQQVSWLLEAAGNDFSRTASSFSGSKADWLDKMSELTKKVSSYILQGTPSDGPKALDQLFANMNLVDQFCG
jgi:hypothetical protein